MSKIIYHCIDHRDDKGYLIALCKNKSHSIRTEVFDYPQHWLDQKNKYPSFWSEHERCKDCLEHEDYPLLVLAHV